jgi:hypothetical protein
MKKVLFILFFLPFMANATIDPVLPVNHCIFIGTNVGEHQSQGNYIIVIGNFKSDMVFRDSSINIDKSFPYFQTPEGKGLLSFIENGHDKTNTKEFFEDLQHVIKTYYLAGIERYVKVRHYDKAFYAFN